MTTNNYMLTYWEIGDNGGIQHTTTLDSWNDLEVIEDAHKFLLAKSEYMDVVEDSFIIETDERTIVHFEYGKLLPNNNKD